MRKLLPFFTLILILSCNSNSDKIVDSHSQSKLGYTWVNILYVNNFKNKLPCKCENDFEYFIIRYDTATKDLRFLKHNASEFIPIDYEKKSQNEINWKFKIQDSIIDNGNFRIKEDTLFWTDRSGKQSIFVNFDPSSKTSKFDYFYDYEVGGIFWLNQSFKIRGYNTLEKILNFDSLGLDCNSRYMTNVIFSFKDKSKAWALELSNDSLMISSFLDSANDYEPPKISKKLIKKLAWKKM